MVDEGVVAMVLVNVMIAAQSDFSASPPRKPLKRFGACTSKTHSKQVQEGS